MPSLSQILAENAPLLVVDAGSERIHAGLLGPGGEARWASRVEEAGTGIFACLDELGVEIDRVRAFAFCEGPGSILGIRTAAAAIRMWCALEPRPVFAYQSLALVAHGLGRTALTVVSDARRGLWHRYAIGTPLSRVPAAELAGELATPAGFRHWEEPPKGTQVVPYDLPGLLADPAVASADLFRATPEPDAFLHQEPAYAKWTPQIHRAP